MQKLKVDMVVDEDENIIRTMTEAFANCPAAIKDWKEIGIPDEKIVVTGNTVVDAAYQNLELSKKQQAESAERKSQIGTGDRSEKVRTYNFPQNRVTDHRINFTSYRIKEIMNGDITEILDSLIAADQAEKLVG